MLLQTSANRAVAHCDEVPEGGAAASPPQRVTWTIKFRRVDDGWVIEDVSTSRPRARRAGTADRPPGWAAPLYLGFSMWCVDRSFSLQMNSIIS